MFNEDELPHVEQWSPDYEHGGIAGILIMHQHTCIHPDKEVADLFPKFDETRRNNILHFIYDARLALDIQRATGWHARLDRYDRWLVYDQDGSWVLDLQVMQDANWTNPFTAIVETYRLLQTITYVDATIEDFEPTKEDCVEFEAEWATEPPLKTREMTAEDQLDWATHEKGPDGQA